MGDCPIRQLILHTRILVGRISWGLNPEMLGSSWLKASATWGGLLRLKASVMGRRAVPLFSLCPGIRLTTEEKHGKPLSVQPSSPGTSRCADLAVFVGLPRLACWTSDHPGFRGDLSQPSVGAGAFRVAVLRDSPHQLSSSRNSRSVL
jgi:hypothetical protein